jgi:hypothetical protein
MATRVAGIEVNLGLNSASFESSAQRARREFRQFQQNVERDTASINKTLTAATASMAGFARGLVAGAAGAVGLAGIGAAARRMADEVREAEQAQLRLQAVLKATGNTTGLTAGQIGEFADSIEKSTLATAEGVQLAATRLATFKGVAGDTFTAALELSQDLTAVMGGDLPGAAEKLGRALADPVEGMSGLTREVRGFSPAAAAMAESLAKTGQMAAAQDVILKELTRTIGGAGEAEASGLTGSLHRADTAAGDFFQRLEEKTGLVAGFAQFVEGATLALNRFGAASSYADRIADKQREILRLSKISEPAASPGTDPEETAQRTAAAAARIKVLEAEIQELIKASHAAQDAAERESAALAEAARKSQEQAAAAMKAAADEEEAKKRVTAAAKAAHDQERAAAEQERRWQEDFNAILAQEEAILKANGVAAKVEADAAMKRISERHEAQQKAQKAEQDAIEESQRQFAALGDSVRESIKDSIAGGIRSALDGEVQSVKDFFDTFLDIAKDTIAQFAALAIMNPGIASQWLSGLGGAGATLGSVAPSAFGGTALGGVGVAGLGVSVLGGYAAGSIAGGLAGRNSTATGIGGALGAGIGFAVGGPIGGFIGAGLGTLAGGIFGGSAANGGTRNNNYQLGYNVVTGRQVDFMNTKPDQANVGNVNAVLTELGTLRQGLRGFGIALGETELTIQSGNRSGLTLNGAAFSSLGGLTEAALDRLLSTASLTAEQRRVAAASNATNAQGLLADIGFIDEFRQMIGAMSPLQAEAKALAASFAVARDRATELGFSQAELAQLTTAERFARAELLQQAGRERGNILDVTAATLGDDAAALRIALRNQAAEYDQLRQRLEDLGGTATQLSRLTRDEAAARAHLIRTTREQARAAREAERQSLLQTRAGFAGEAQSIFSFLPDLQNFGASIATSGVGSGTRLDQFQALQVEYQRTLRMARGGDQTALGNVDDLGRQYLAAARDVYASGPRFAELEAQVRGNIDSLADKFGKLQRDHFADLMADNRNNVITQTNALVRKLDDLQKAFEKAAFGNLYNRRAS